ncbi:MAG: DUF6807 family protein [Armatimonadota bacterium]
MTMPRYAVLQNSPGPQNPSLYMVCETASGRLLGGLGANFYRPWVYPLYTSSGRTVIQEYAFDHPFHNGFFVAQYPVQVGERIGNFWVTPPRRGFDDPVYTRIGRVDAAMPPVIESSNEAIAFTINSVWRDEDEQPLIDEVRTVTFRTLADATVCDVASRKIAAYGPAEFPQTKFGSLGIRVEPRLLPPLGGVVIADDGRRGTAALVDAQRESDYVAYENTVVGHTFGVCLHILDAGVRGPWFVRDYGMAMYNSTFDRSFSLTEGEEWTASLRVIAYDEPLTESRVRHWIGHA